jgi:hypothetical protein
VDELSCLLQKQINRQQCWRYGTINTIVDMVLKNGDQITTLNLNLAIKTLERSYTRIKLAKFFMCQFTNIANPANIIGTSIVP